MPAELVGRIVEGRVHLTVTKDELGRMTEFEEPPASVEISSESAEQPWATRVWLRIKRLFGG